MKCSVEISETADGKLVILAHIPEGAENTVAGRLAKTLIAKAAEEMNEVLGADQKVEAIGSA